MQVGKREHKPGKTRTKPCPFCGGEAIAKFIQNNENVCLYLVCTRCYSRGPDINYHPDVQDSQSHSYEWACDIWNKRTADETDIAWAKKPDKQT